MNVTCVGLAEYFAAWIFSDGSARRYTIGADGKIDLIPFNLNGAKAVNMDYGFNQIIILDENSCVWTSQAAGEVNKIGVDALNNLFNDVVSIGALQKTYVVIRKDGSLWFWGDEDRYLQVGGAVTIYPKRLNQPDGVQFKKISCGLYLLGLDANGNVWEWDGGHAKQISLPGPATDIAASRLGYNYAIVNGAPYAWGLGSNHWGNTLGVYIYNTPQALKDKWKLTTDIVSITCTDNVTHFIDSNGDLWGIGDNAQGEIGDGWEQVPNYAWPWNTNPAFKKDGGTLYEFPVHILPGVKFKKVFSGSTEVFYHYALDVNDNLYFWGRQKGWVSATGQTLSSNAAQNYPNGIDITAPTVVNPLNNPVMSIIDFKPGGPPPPPPPPSTPVIIGIDNVIHYSDNTSKTIKVV